jgi:hypothetical protein
MVIFHSYVSLPEGTSHFLTNSIAVLSMLYSWLWNSWRNIRIWESFEGFTPMIFRGWSMTVSNGRLEPEKLVKQVQVWTSYPQPKDISYEILWWTVEICEYDWGFLGLWILLENHRVHLDNRCMVKRAKKNCWTFWNELYVTTVNQIYEHFESTLYLSEASVNHLNVYCLPSTLP